VAVALMGLHKLGRSWRAVIAAAMELLVTAAFLPFREHLNPTEVALTLLLVVLFAATLFGSTAGLVASVFGILCFNFFFLPPYGTLTISDPENWVAFGAFVITALIAGQISGYARRRAEESEARQQEIERLYDELRAAFEQASEAEALRRSEKLKSALLDAVTHDLRTPLTSIKASVTTLLEDAKEAMLDRESRGEFLEIIDEETDRLDEFIEGMVGIAKIEAGAMNLAKRPSPMDEIVTNALQRAEKILGDRRVEVRMPAGPPNVYADAVSVAEVLFTLVDNAARYSPAGTQVRVTVKQRDGSVEIAVEDQGEGIPLKMRGRIFDKFVRLDEQDIHRTGSGLGLGLAIAKGIVESQGGTITVGDGSDGFATRFAVTLPAAEA
jgi:two-component system sensor histidine kinase KdpD